MTLPFVLLGLALLGLPFVASVSFARLIRGTSTADGRARAELFSRRARRVVIAGIVVYLVFVLLVLLGAAQGPVA